MPASKEKIGTASPAIKKLGVIAGGGDVPLRLLRACARKGIEVFVVGFKGQTDPSLMEGHAHLWGRLGALGKTLAALRAQEISDLVMIGSIRRPTLTELAPDLRAAKFFSKIAMKALGDNDLLTALRRELEGEGFTLHGAHKFAEELLAPFGVIGNHKPNKQDLVNIEHGLKISQTLGALDVGQAVIVQEGLVLGVEAIEGTDQLIERAAHLSRKGRGGVLVKTCKPQQDRDFDLPTIGPETIRNAYKAGLVGVAIHAGAALLIDREELVKIADQCKIFVIGVEV